jgi:hypothetical protein
MAKVEILIIHQVKPNLGMLNHPYQQIHLIDQWSIISK